MLVLAHRGLHTDVRENTVAAFEAAAAAGADGVELDVRMSLDGALVVHHDPVVPGVGVIASTRRCELPAYVPTLEEALDACGPLFVNVEVKNDPGEPGFDPTETCAKRAARVCAARLGSGGLAGLVVSSFSRACLSTLKDAEGELPLAWLVAPAAPGSPGSLELKTSEGREAPVSEVLLRQAVESGYEGLHPWHHMVDEELAAGARRAGIAIRAWTVDDHDQVERLAGLEIAALVTNDVPGALLALGRS